jgi:hypothetical protein
VDVLEHPLVAAGVALAGLQEGGEEIAHGRPSGHATSRRGDRRRVRRPTIPGGFSVAFFD